MSDERFDYVSLRDIARLSAKDAMTPDEQAVEHRARELLAAASGVAVESDTEIDLRDRDQVFVEDALAAP